MYSRIGVNKSKELNSVLKNIKVPKTSRATLREDTCCYDIDDFEFYDDDFRKDNNEDSCSCMDGCLDNISKMNIDYKKWALVSLGVVVGVTAIACLMKRR